MTSRARRKGFRKEKECPCVIGVEKKEKRRSLGRSTS